MVRVRAARQQCTDQEQPMAQGQDCHVAKRMLAVQHHQQERMFGTLHHHHHHPDVPVQHHCCTALHQMHSLHHRQQQHTMRHQEQPLLHHHHHQLLQETKWSLGSRCKCRQQCQQHSSARRWQQVHSMQRHPRVWSRVKRLSVWWHTKRRWDWPHGCTCGVDDAFDLLLSAVYKALFALLCFCCTDRVGSDGHIGFLLLLLCCRRRKTAVASPQAQQLALHHSQQLPHQHLQHLETSLQRSLQPELLPMHPG